MSSVKSLMFAIMALFFMATTVAAADLFIPGNPVNCTSWGINCKALAKDLYGNNGTFFGALPQCTNSTTLTQVQPLCNYKVNCIVSFLSNSPASSSSAAATTTTTTTTSAPLPTGNETTTSARPAATGIPIPSVSQNYVDLTSQLLAKYDTTKCSSANLARLATSAGSLTIIVIIASFVSNLL